MYAVVQTGGKQYRVSAGDKVRVEKLEADNEPRKFTIEELKQIILTYKQKRKDLINGFCR